MGRLDQFPLLLHLSLAFNKVASVEQVLAIKQKGQIKSLSLAGNPLEEQHPDWAY